MWKYVSRRIRDTFERSANHFDRRSATVVNPAGLSEDKNKHTEAPCRWFCRSTCWDSFRNDRGTNSKKWNFEYLNRTWIGAITWSSALVAGWYTGQLIHIKFKHNTNKENTKDCRPNILSCIHTYLEYINKKAITYDSRNKLEDIVQHFTPTVHLISNESHEGSAGSSNTTNSSTTNPDASDDDLGNVLNSIENRLGLAAIENGQHKDGLILLRSAANRNHAPALYNLGICHEMGLGVKADEKVAMELYRSAAALEHPGALYNLGIYYGQGRGGLTRDVKTATRLLRLAAVQGQQDAIDAIKVLELETVDDNDPWSYHCNQFMQEHIVPAQTTLFVENVNFLHHQRDVRMY